MTPDLTLVPPEPENGPEHDRPVGHTFTCDVHLLAAGCDCAQLPADQRARLTCSTCDQRAGEHFRLGDRLLCPQDASDWNS